MRNTGYVLLTVIVMTLLVVLSLPVLADPFSDVPQDHWAYDAVQMLEEKGLVEGYPDGLFKGDRAMTRYEMAMVVARVIAKLEQVQASIPQIPDLSIYATKQDLETINKLLGEFRNELDALGVRVNNIEDSLGKLTARVDELERVKISGDFETIAASVGIHEKDNRNDGGPGGIYVDPNGVRSINGDIDRYMGSTLMFGTQVAYPYAPRNANLSTGYTTTGGPLPASNITVNPFIQSAQAGKPEFALNEGFGISSKLTFTVTAKIADNVTAGGDLTAYSAFGDNGVYNTWGVTPQYNTLGVISAMGPGVGNMSTFGNYGTTPGGLDFQANLATLWFKTTGDWNITGKMGDYNLNNVSHNLFYGVRNPYYSYDKKDVLPLNGLDFSGRLYDTVDVEMFYARDVNTVQNGQSAVWFLQNPTDAKYSVNGAFSYQVPTYRNVLQGFWAGYDAMEKRLHVEGSYMRVYEDAASNPGQYITNDIAGFNNRGSLTLAPQDEILWGVKAHYMFAGEKLTIYGEIAGSQYSANLVDNFNRTNGYLFQIGAKAKILDDKLDLYGEYVRTDAKYDPFGFHQTWERAYGDTLHEGWDDMAGFGFAVRPGKFRPNRHGLDMGVTYKLAAGEIFGRFTYLQQVVATQRNDASEDGFNFSGYDPIVNNYAAGTSAFAFGPVNGRPNVTLNGFTTDLRNVNGNQDYFFLYNGANKGSEFFVEVGGKYDFGGNLHVFGDWNYMKFKRDYATAPTGTGLGLTPDEVNWNQFGNGRTDQNGYLPTDIGLYNPTNWANTDFSAHFTHLGVTYDVTEKFAVQGNFAYVKNSGVDDSGFNQDNSTVIPGLALRYKFNDVTSLVFDYKYYSFSDNRVLANDYTANKIVTRLNVKF